MIKRSEISVIVQGPYYPNITDKVLNNIYNQFKGSELIFSTYKDTNLDNNFKKKFKILINKNPKKTPMSLKPLQYYNYCGQIRTTLNGLKYAKNKFCLKTRSDVIFTSKNFLDFFDKYKKFNKKLKILEKKVLLSSFNTVDPQKEPLPFHFSDWFYFGLKKDLLKIFNQNYMSKENMDVPLWFLNKRKPKYFFNNYMSRYRTEQHITKNFLQKYINLKLNHGYEHNIKNIMLTEKILSNNFVILNPSQISIKSLKHPNFLKNNDLIYFNEKITNHKWQKLYKKYCSQDFKINSIEMSSIVKTILWTIKSPKQAIYRFIMYKKNKLI